MRSVSVVCFCGFGMLFGLWTLRCCANVLCTRHEGLFFRHPPPPVEASTENPEPCPTRTPTTGAAPSSGGVGGREQDREPRGGVVFWQGPKVIFNGDYVGTHEHFAPKDWNSSRLCSRCSHLKVGPLPPNAPFSKPRIEALPVVGLSPFDGEGPASNVARAGQGAGSGEHSEAD